MKKTLFWGLAVLSSLAFVACEKQQEIKEPGKMITVTLTAQKAGEDTKTAAVEGADKVSYEWTEEDKDNLRLFDVTIGDDDKEELTVLSPDVTISSDNRILTISAQVQENSTIRAVVAGDWTSSNKPKVKVAQSPETDNFDPSADILVSEDMVVTEAEDLALTFHRQAVVAKMTLKNLKGNEKISKVTISSSETNITGYYDYAEDVMKGQNKEIVLSYDDVDASAEFPVYFVAMPNEGVELTVVAKTDKYTYTKTFGPVNFTLGKFTKFGVDMSESAEEVVDVDYSGEWIIAGTHGDFELAATAWTSGNFYPASVVTLDSDNEIVTVVGESADAYKMTIERIEEGDYAGMYTIKDANGNYLSATSSSSNNMQGKTELSVNSYWNIEKNTDGTYNIEASESEYTRNSLRVNYNNGSNPRFSCYATTSGQPKPVLYPFANVKVEEPEEPTEAYKFKKVSAVTSGRQYLIVADADGALKAAKPLTSNYGYLQVDDVTESDGIITVGELTNAFTFTTAGDGYTIKQSDDRYLYQTGTYNSFNVNADPESGQYFTVEANTDGTFKITNIAVSKYMQYSTGYTSYGSYSDEQGIMPYLYEYQDGSVEPDPEPEVDGVVDKLTREITGVTGTSYSDWSGKTVTSSAVYAGQSAGSNESIQLRSNGNNSGVVTTASGGKVKKIVVEWNSNTVSGRTLNVYGKNSAYSAATDLYSSDTQGTLLGTIVYGTSTELEVEGDYTFIGFRSASGAMYLTSVSITWDK